MNLLFKKFIVAMIKNIKFYEKKSTYSDVFYSE